MTARDANRMEWHVGATVHAQPVRLVRERVEGGRVTWSIHRDALGQRDEPDTITGLDAETMRTMAEIVKEHP